jgi:subtilase family serine protease
VRQTSALAQHAQNATKVPYATDRFIVRYKSELIVTEDLAVTGIPSIDALNSRHTIRNLKRLFKETPDDPLKKSHGLTRTYMLKVDQGSDIPQIIKDYRQDPNVEYAEPDFIASITLVPNDPSFSSQWSLDNIGQTGGKVDADIDAPEAWDISTGSGSTVIAIVDTGVDMQHPDLVSKIVPGYDFVNDDADPTDDYGHGTHVAGIASASSNNAQGATGICWACKIMPVKVLDASGGGYYSWIAGGIVFSADSGAKVINMSLGGLFGSQTLQDAIEYAYSKGVVIVAAMGNGGDLTPSYPAVYPEVIAVGATDYNDLRAQFSTFGGHIDVVAPGVDILSTVPPAGDSCCSDPSGYMLLSGTSMATPHVAGLAGLIRSFNPSLSRDQVYSILKHSAEDRVGSTTEDTPGWDPYYGWGRINAANALSEAFAPPSDPALIRTTPNNVVFTVPEGGCNTYRQTVDLENIGGGIIDWSAAANAPWLSVTPTSGSRPGFLTITANPAGLTPGPLYSGNVTVTAAAGNSPLSIPVALQVLDNASLPRCEALLSEPTFGSGNPSGATVQNGESVIAWSMINSYNGFFGNDTFAQRVDATGTPLWGTEGRPLPVVEAQYEQHSLRVVHDGADGVLIVWIDFQPSEAIISAKRLDPDGTALWETPIVEVPSSGIYSSIDESSVQAVPDGTGGSIVIWRQDISVFPGTLRAQRVSSGGVLQWGPGITLGAGVYLNAVPDEAGGVFVAWSNSSGAFAQHIDGDGHLSWSAGGVSVGFGFIGIPTIVSDDAGGAIIAGATSFPFDVFAQRIDASGQPLWGSGGRQLTTTGLSGDFIFAVSDGSGGAIIVYQDARDGNLDIYAQRVSPFGEPLWVSNGAPVTRRPYHDFTQPLTQAVSDGGGGVLVTWDGYSGINWDVFAQHLNSSGQALWGPDGISVSAAAVSQINPSALRLSPDRALFTWVDSRGTNLPDGPFLVLGGDIFSQVIRFTSPDLDTESPSAPSDLQIGIVTGDLFNGIYAELHWTAATDNVGVAGYEIFRDGVMIGNSPATFYLDRHLQPTRQYCYTVVAFDGAGNRSLPSNAACATTPPDEQPPTDPGLLSAAAISSTKILLTWEGAADDVGVSGYNIYMTPPSTGIETKVATIALTRYTNTVATPGVYCYRVTAFDVAGNESSPGAVACTSTARPDLVVGNLTATISGTNIILKDSVKNQAKADAGPFDVSFYLSTNTTLDDTDALICSRTVAGLAAGALDPPSGTMTTTCPVLDVAPGSYYYVVVKDDSGGAVAESNETNNTKYYSTRLVIGPDLLPRVLTASTSGTDIILKDSVKNQGKADAGPFDISFYLSANTTLDGTDTLICSRTVAGLAAGALDPPSGTMTTTCPVPDIAPGLYYVIVFDDSGGAVAETNEANNTKYYATSLSIGPDLIRTAFTASTSGTDIILKDSVKNQGKADAGPFDISFYLSANTTLDGTDTLICSRTVAGLAAGALDPPSGTMTTTCPVPDIAPGLYYVIVFDDSGGAVAETNEANNTKYYAIGLSIRPDLIPTAATVTKSGSTLTLTDSVKNKGTADAGGFTISFYFSTDTVYQAGTDTFICSRSVGGLAAGASDPSSGTIITTCMVPATVPAGIYRVIVVDDSGGVIAEASEANNAKATATTITEP